MVLIYVITTLRNVGLLTCEEDLNITLPPPDRRTDKMLQWYTKGNVQEVRKQEGEELG